MTDDPAMPAAKAARTKGRMAFNLILIALVIISDQISKWMVTELVMRPHHDKGASLDFMTWITTMPDKMAYAEFPILPFYNIVMVWNYGVSFGMFNQQSTENAFLLVGVALAISLFLLIWMFGEANKYIGMGLALAVGGAFGNVIDRMRFGAVADFLDIHAFGYHWPAFNVADSCIVVGIGIVIINSLFFDKKADK